MELNYFVVVAPFLQKLLSMHDQTTLVISDTEQFLYVSDELGLGLSQGQKIPNGSGTYQVLKSKQPLYQMIEAEKSVFKRAYTVYSIPLFMSDEEIQGVISWAIPTNKAKISGMATELSALSEELTATSDEFATHAIDLEVTHETVQVKMGQLIGQMQSVANINNTVREISQQTQLLGLNASIEAAHAGENGRGFSIVANEIRKLANESQESAKEISSNLELIQSMFNEMVNQIDKVARIVTEQTAGATQLNQAIRQITGLAVSLDELSH